jgi:hypothetical protein
MGSHLSPARQGANRGEVVEVVCFNPIISAMGFGDGLSELTDCQTHGLLERHLQGDTKFEMRLYGLGFYCKAIASA